MAYIRREPTRLHTVVETPEFLSAARKVLTEAERLALDDFIAAHPAAGDLMRETGGARKLRWATGSRGKSGGVRVITFYAGVGIPVFLMAMFGKNEKANLSKAERNELRQILASVAARYRKSRK